MNVLRNMARGALKLLRANGDYYAGERGPQIARRGPTTADEYLEEAASIMRERAAARDTPDGERSMERAVCAFNALYGGTMQDRVEMGLTPLSETLGWEFMTCLKKARKAAGGYTEDDYVDDIAYSALSAESEGRAQGGALRHYLVDREGTNP